jgi:hypothetical protein
MARKKHTSNRRPTVRTVAAAIALATAGVATAAWLTSAQETTRVTTITSTTTAATTTTAAASASAQAQKESVAVATAQPTSAPSPSSPSSTSPAPSAPSAAGQRAFIDPATGQLRQPEHEELAAIAAEAAAAPARRTAARSAGAAAQMFGTDGSVSATVPEELHTFTVATRGPDGRLVIDHAQGRTNAARMVKANSAKNTPRASVSGAQQKEDRNDR